MGAYDDAVVTLHRGPFADFVQERKRLAAELKAAGEKEAATRLSKLARPPVSAWAVNQLWWREREAFEGLIAAAAQVKAGVRDASRTHREALSELRERAARLLQEAGNAATEATLRRVTTTLSAIAAMGSFDPDPPGALSADRDPPGFEALGFGAAPSKAPEPVRDDSARRAAEAERRRAEAEAEKRRQAEREQLMGRLREARALQTAQQRELSRLKAEVETAEQGLKETQALLARLEDQLTNL
jgi:DNA repair exonuclease SbcCD ATPase subunit